MREKNEKKKKMDISDFIKIYTEKIIIADMINLIKDKRKYLLSVKKKIKQKQITTQYEIDFTSKRC